MIWSKSRYIYDEKVDLVWRTRLNYHVWDVFTPYPMCLGMFVWLFYDFNSFYDPKYPKICYIYVCDQKNVDLLWRIRIK